MAETRIALYMDIWTNLINRANEYKSDSSPAMGGFVIRGKYLVTNRIRDGDATCAIWAQ